MNKWKCLAALILLSLNPAAAQTVTDYQYRLNNGVTVNIERGWNWRRAEQSFIKQTKPGPTSSLRVEVKAVGDLIAGAGVKIIKEGREVNADSLLPGSYQLDISCPLASATKGTIEFKVTGVIIKPKMDTEVRVSIYDYQITIDEKAEPNKGLAYYETKTNRYSGNWEQNLNWSRPWFYASGDRSRRLTAAEQLGAYYGRIHPGTYDLGIHIENTAGPEHLVWLNNLTMKSDMSYRIATNLNAAEVVYTGGEYEVKVLHFYPSGTAARMKGRPMPDKKIELFALGSPSIPTPCPPGKYDVLLNYGHGVKYVWRPGLVLEPGKKTAIK